MSAHVLNELADFLEGRLAEDRMGEIRDHIADCRECGELYEFATDLRSEIVRRALRHLSPDRIVALTSEARSEFSEAETEHLKICSACRDEVDWMRNLPHADSVGVETTAPPASAPRRVRRSRARIFVPLAAAAALLLFVLLRSGDEPVTSLARIEPLPVELTRGDDLGDGFAEERLKGLSLYETSDYSGAIECFAGALAIRPRDPEVSLYLASSELMRGNPEEAVEILRGASDDAPAEVLEEIQWQLANAYLAAGDAGRAKAALEIVRTYAGFHEAEAADLLEELR